MLKQYCSSSFGNSSLPDWKMMFTKKKMLIRRCFLAPAWQIHDLAAATSSCHIAPDVAF